MDYGFPRLARPLVAAALLFFPPTASSQKSKQPHAGSKASSNIVASYDEGVFFVTDGSLPNGPCFRVTGKINAPKFFENLKRVDGPDGATFRRGPEVVGEFPDQLILSFIIHDQPCAYDLEHVASGRYLTRSLVSTLRLNLYWKSGIDLRPISGVSAGSLELRPIVPYAAGLVNDLPERFEWRYEFAVPSADVPLTDSLVLIIRTADNYVAARVAARL